MHDTIAGSGIWDKNVGRTLQQARDGPDPGPLADPKSRSPLGCCDLHRRSTRLQNWGDYFLDPPRRLSEISKSVLGLLLYHQQYLNRL